ncbi:uncharacterized protein TNCV_164471 [Trichonephila clavipes]|nr:uncharacterized protein TNCV_164471 [Trichonephila clavipes]
MSGVLRVRVLVLLKIHRVEELMHVRSVEAQSPHVHVKLGREASSGAVLLRHDRNAFVSSDGTHWPDHLRLAAFKYGRCRAFLTTRRYNSGTGLRKIRSTGNTIVLIIHQSEDAKTGRPGFDARCHQTPSECTRSTCSLNQWVRSLVGLFTSAGTGEYFPPLQFTCRNCGGGDRGRVAIYRPFGEVSLSLNRTVTCMVLKANDRRTSCPCHDEFRGPRSDYVRQVALATTTTTTTCVLCDVAYINAIVQFPPYSTPHRTINVIDSTCYPSLHFCHITRQRDLRKLRLI